MGGEACQISPGPQDSGHCEVSRVFCFTHTLALLKVPASRQFPLTMKELQKVKEAGQQEMVQGPSACWA